MTIRHNFTDRNFWNLGSRWLHNDETDYNAIIAQFMVDEYNSYGCGDDYLLDTEKLLSLNNLKSNKLLLKGIYAFSEARSIRFRRVCVIISRADVSNDTWGFDGAEIRVEGGTINDLIQSESYSSDAVYSMLEKFGYDYCCEMQDDDGNEGLAYYKEFFEECVKGTRSDDEETFIEWFRKDDLMDPEQLPEPECSGLHWTYCHFLDWDSMVTAVYSGVGRWREEQLRLLEENK